MPYTALQTLGWMAHHNKWQRLYTVRRVQHKRSTCKLQAVRGQTLRKDKKLIIFKRTGPGKTMNWYHENPPCGLAGCCEVCGVFNEIFVKELETELPALKREQ